MKNFDELSAAWPFQKFNKKLLHFEGLAGTFLLFLLLNCFLLIINFLFYGNIGLFHHGQHYFLRSIDPFLTIETVRPIFVENYGVENVALPFFAHLVNKGLILFGLNYTKDVYYVLSIMPYFVFMVLFSCVVRKPMGIVGAVALTLAVHSSGITPYMLSWGGYVDGLNYLIIFFAFLAINKSYPVTLLLIVMGALNHYLSVLGILIISLSMFIMKPNKKYIGIVLFCLVILCVTNFVWTNLVGAEEARSVHLVETLKSRHAFKAHTKEVYSVFPWNFLSPLKLLTIPLLYLALLLFKKRFFLGFGYILPLALGFIVLLTFNDVTRLLTHFFMISFFMMIAFLSNGMNFNKLNAFKMNFRDKKKLFSLIVLCSFIGIFIPNFYVDNGHIIVPNGLFKLHPKQQFGKNMIAVGNPKPDPTQNKLGSASMRFNGQGDRLEIADHEDWTFSEKDFTIDFWIRFAHITENQVLIGYPDVSPDLSWQIAYEEGYKSLRFSYSIDGDKRIDERFPWSPLKDNWYHLAVVRKRSNLKLFINGIQISQTHKIGGFPLHDSTSQLLIGSNGSEEYFNGWLDEIRISKGKARWTSNFVPQSREYSRDSYTKLLLHCNDVMTFFVINKCP